MNIALSYGAKVFQYLESFRYGSWVWQTDRQAELALAIALSNDPH